MKLDIKKNYKKLDINEYEESFSYFDIVYGSVKTIKKTMYVSKNGFRFLYFNNIDEINSII